jgi:hypothetical protein
MDLHIGDIMISGQNILIFFAAIIFSGALLLFFDFTHCSAKPCGPPPLIARAQDSWASAQLAPERWRTCSAR